MVSYSRDEVGAAAGEYVGITAMIIGGSAAFAVAYQRWLAEAFGGNPAGQSFTGLTQVLSSWGEGGSQSGLSAVLAGGLGLVALVVLLVTRRFARRRASRGVRWGSAVMVATVFATVLVGLRFALGRIEGMAVGLPSDELLMSVLVAATAAVAGGVVGWICRARTHIEAMIAGAAAGFVVAMFGQLSLLIQGSTPDVRSMLMTGGVVMLSAVGGLVGSAFALGGGVGALEEGAL